MGLKPIRNECKQGYAAEKPAYLTIIPLALMGSESIAHDAKGRMGY